MKRSVYEPKMDDEIREKNTPDGKRLSTGISKIGTDGGRFLRLTVG